MGANCSEGLTLTSKSNLLYLQGEWQKQLGSQEAAPRKVVVSFDLTQTLSGTTTVTDPGADLVSCTNRPNSNSEVYNPTDTTLGEA